MSRPDLPWFQRLAFLIIGFLSIALLPIGLISVVQTQRVSQDDRESTEITLLAVTERAALTERNSIEHAWGAATALTVFGELFMKDSAACEFYFSQLVARAERYNFIGVVGLAGNTMCSSSGRLPDYSQTQGLADAIEKQSPAFMLDLGKRPEDPPIISVFQPFNVSSAVTGFVVISQHHLPLRLDDAPIMRRGFVGLATMNNVGDVLTYSGDKASITSQLPLGLTTADITKGGKRAFSAENAEGKGRIYAVVPVLDNAVFALGIWDDTAIQSDQYIPVSPALFPILMWLASLLVAILAMHRLVIRHVRRLSARMQEFARDRKVHRTQRQSDMPAELAVITNDFETMALDILRDEAELEDTLRSKDVLLKEVHHRVKNNLQLIASIMNIQLRSTDNAHTAAVVRHLQERVLSLATIHQNLYNFQSHGRVNAGLMIAEIVNKSRILTANLPYAIEFVTELDDILLYPDQAVPLSLLVTEILGAATNYQASSADLASIIGVSVRLTDQGECELKITNSSGGAQSFETNKLGETLIKAFVVQLGGKLIRDPEPGASVLSVCFPVEDFAFETEDY